MQGGSIAAHAKQTRPMPREQLGVLPTTMASIMCCEASVALICMHEKNHWPLLSNRKGANHGYSSRARSGLRVSLLMPLLHDLLHLRMLLLPLWARTASKTTHRPLRSYCILLSTPGSSYPSTTFFSMYMELWTTCPHNQWGTPRDSLPHLGLPCSKPQIVSA